MNLKDFHLYVVRPTLDLLDAGGIHAERLVCGTALIESKLDRLRQVGGGPALGVFQIEPATCDDIHRYLTTKGAFRGLIENMMTCEPRSTQLITNLSYATSICRMKYWMDPEPLGDTLHSYAKTWKRVYNTPAGAGTTEKFVRECAAIMELN